MGLTHSSAVCDAALFFLAEATWATKIEIQRAHAIHAYYRFKDDIWILAGDRGRARRFISRFGDLAAKVFESELVECSQRSVVMIGVITVVEGGSLHTEPRPKYRGPPLSHQSAHPLSVHLRWPSAHWGGELDLCSTESTRERVNNAYIKRFQEKYTQSMVDDSLIKVPLFEKKTEKEKPCNEHWNRCHG
ncbi:MAG: hypothetical protein ACKPKO_64515, partial [Candidatus Fonsibacter sp.]